MSTKKETQAKLSSWAEEIEKAKTMPDVFPNMKFEDNETKVITFLEGEPKLVNFKDDDGNDKEGLCIKVRDEKLQVENNLWLTSATLKTAVAKMWTRFEGTLLNKTVKLTCEIYQHEKYGPTRGYRASPMTNPIQP